MYGQSNQGFFGQQPMYGAPTGMQGPAQMNAMPTGFPQQSMAPQMTSMPMQMPVQQQMTSMPMQMPMQPMPQQMTSMPMQRPMQQPMQQSMQQPMPSQQPMQSFQQPMQTMSRPVPAMSQPVQSQMTAMPMQRPLQPAMQSFQQPPFAHRPPVPQPSMAPQMPVAPPPPPAMLTQPQASQFESFGPVASYQVPKAQPDVSALLHQPSMPQPLAPQQMSLYQQHVESQLAPQYQQMQQEAYASNVKVPWALTDEEKQTYDNIFQAWDPHGTGFLDGAVAKEVFQQSGLDNNELMAIWTLADADNRGKLNRSEFHIAMGLVYRRLNGNPIPNELPPEMNSTAARDLSGSVDFVKSLLKNETRSGNRAETPADSKPRSFSAKQPPSDAAVYKHDDASVRPTYTSSRRHVSRTNVPSAAPSRDEAPLKSADEELEDLKAQFKQAHDKLDPSSRDVRLQIRSLKTRIADLRDLIEENLASSYRTPDREADRKRLEEELSYLESHDLPKLIEAMSLGDRKVSEPGPVRHDKPAVSPKPAESPKPVDSSKPAASTASPAPRSASSPVAPPPQAAPSAPLTQEERLKQAKEQAQKRIQERLRALGVATQEDTSSDSSLQQRIDQERREAEDRSRKADEEARKRREARQPPASPAPQARPAPPKPQSRPAPANPRSFSQTPPAPAPPPMAPASPAPVTPAQPSPSPPPAPPAPTSLNLARGGTPANQIRPNNRPPPPPSDDFDDLPAPKPVPARAPSPPRVPQSKVPSPPKALSPPKAPSPPKAQSPPKAPSPPKAFSPPPQVPSAPAPPPQPKAVAPPRPPADDFSESSDDDEEDDDDNVLDRKAQSNLAQVFFGGLGGGGPPPPPPAPAPAPASAARSPPSAAAPPPPPPPAAPSPSEPGAAGPRPFLADIQKGAALRKTQTKDSSGPKGAGRVIGSASPPQQALQLSEPEPEPETEREPDLGTPAPRPSFGQAFFGEEAAPSAPDPAALAFFGSAPGDDQAPADAVPAPAAEFYPVRSLFQYDAQLPTDLGFPANIVLEVQSGTDPDWLFGKHNGAEGWLPASFVAPFSVESRTAAFAYDAPSEEQISFVPGDTLSIVDSSDPDWWCALDNGRILYVPAAYLSE